MRPALHPCLHLRKQTTVGYADTETTMTKRTTTRKNTATKTALRRNAPAKAKASATKKSPASKVAKTKVALVKEPVQDTAPTRLGTAVEQVQKRVANMEYLLVKTIRRTTMWEEAELDEAMQAAAVAL